MVIPIQPSGPGGAPERKPVSAKDIKVALKSQSDINALQRAHAAAKAAQKQQLGSKKSATTQKQPLGSKKSAATHKKKSSPKTPAHGLGDPNDPINKSYTQYIQAALNYLNHEKPPLPTAFIQTQLNSLIAEMGSHPPTLDSSLATVMFQVIRLGTSFGDVKGFSALVKSTFGGGVKSASDLVDSLTKQIKVLETSYPGLGPIIEIQSYLDNYENNPHSGTALANLASAVSTLSDQYASLSGSFRTLASSTFAELSHITTGSAPPVPLSKVIAIIYYEKALQYHQTWDRNDPVPSVVGKYTYASVPFMQSVETVIKTFGSDPGRLPGLDIKDISGYGYEYNVDPDFMNQIAAACTWTSGSVKNAQNAIDGGVSTFMTTFPGAAQYIQLKQDLNQAQSLLTAFQNAESGDFKDAFPSPPYKQGSTDPSDLDPYLNQIIMLFLNGPNLNSTGREALMEIFANAPPYPKNCIDLMIIDAGPLTPAQKTALGGIEKAIQKEIDKTNGKTNADKASQKEHQPVYNEMQIIENFLAEVKANGLKSITGTEWMKIAPAIVSLLETYGSTKDPDLKAMIKSFITCFDRIPDLTNTPTGVNSLLGQIVYAYEVSQKQTPAQINALGSAMGTIGLPIGNGIQMELIADVNTYPPGSFDPTTFANSIALQIYTAAQTTPGSADAMTSQGMSCFQGETNYLNSLATDIAHNTAQANDLTALLNALKIVSPIRSEGQS